VADDEPTLAQMAELLHDANEVRVRDLEAKSGGQASLENAFDALKMIVMLEHICAWADINDATMLDFEGRRAEMLSDIEHKYEQMVAARDAAERQQRLTGMMPNRQQRRHPGPQGIVRP
jgi:hypothetical protein